MKLLYYSPASYGGLADYAHEQANALDSLGIEVILLCTPNYLNCRSPKYKCVPILREVSSEVAASKLVVLNKVLKAIYFIRNTLYNISMLVSFIHKAHIQDVLFGSYAEYFAPLWAGSLKKLAKSGVTFGAVVHDPVRDFVLGPLWWHRLSIAAGYSFLQLAFVHEAIQLDTVKPMPDLKVTVIPHGPYAQAAPTESVAETRARLRLPIEAKVMLAFGHIRANKNLDLVIRAMVQVPDVHLVIAGKELQTEQNLVARYQQLAESLGVGDRCRWEIGFVDEPTVANLFNMADLILLTYSRSFYSASGVLNMAAGYQRACLVSAGTSALKSIAQQYQLGLWVEPDDVDAIIQGIKQWKQEPLKLNWPKFIEENSWHNNAQLVVKTFKSQGLNSYPHLL
ncbi:MAG: glycosyltransferase family 4 protein [Phormidesmis sp. RL_2_1]|nr:glycosyltransferase family 4 protein [Phormidesmis sp. RL_2_1]